VAGSPDPQVKQEAENMMDVLATTKTVSRRFTVVDRSLIHEVLREQELVAAMSNLKGRLTLGKLLPAEVMFAARVRKDPLSTEIVLEGVSTETGIRVMPRVDVAGPSDQIRDLTETLGIRLAQEFPRVRGTVVDVAEGKAGRIREEDERIPAVFIAEVVPDRDGIEQDEADLIVGQLVDTPEMRQRFTIVDRRLIQEVLQEQTLSEYLAEAGTRLPRERLIAAQVAFSLRPRRIGDQLHLLLTGVNAETGERIGETIEVVGPADESVSPIQQLGRKLAAEFPRLKPVQYHGAPQGRPGAAGGAPQGRPGAAGGAPQGRPGAAGADLSKVVVDVGRTQGIRENLKCLLFRMEEVRDAQSGETLGTKPVVLREGTIESVRNDTSSAALMIPEEGQQPSPGRVETGQYVITK
jgi:hypothetical protein